MAKGKKGKGNKRSGGADQDAASAGGAEEDGGRRLTKREQRMLERDAAYGDAASEGTSQTDAAPTQQQNEESGGAPTKGSKKKRQKQAQRAAAAAAAAAAADNDDDEGLNEDLNKLDLEENDADDAEDDDGAGVDDVVGQDAQQEEEEEVEQQQEVVPIAPVKKSMFQMLDSDSDSDSDKSDEEDDTEKEQEKQTEQEVVVAAPVVEEPVVVLEDAALVVEEEDEATAEAEAEVVDQAQEEQAPTADAAAEAEDTSSRKKDKKKKSKREKFAKKEKKEKKEKKSKKKKSVDGDDDNNNEDYDEGEEGEEGVVDAAPAPAVENGDKKEKKKKKLSNKERRALRDQEAGAREQAEMASISKANAKSTQFAVSMSAVREDDNWANSTDIYIPDFTVSAYGKTLFENAELKITAGRRYGLVGPNGMGKTTVLKQLANGELRIPPKIDVLYVEQEVKADDTTAVDMVMQADENRTALLARENEILEMMDDGAYTEELQAELNSVTNELKAAGSDTAEARALAILHGLGFTLEMQTAATKTFSGGWRMRVSIARALFMQPTLLLLDEPTNHLDLNAVIWLDDYLQKWKSTLLVVSHDQEFLDSVCTDIIHLHQRQLFYYRGNYELFKEQFEKTKVQEERAYEKQQKAIKQNKKSGLSAAKASEKEKRRAARGQDAGGKKASGKKGGESASSADAAARLLSRPKDYVVEFNFPGSRVEISAPFIQVNDVTFHYPKGPDLFKNVTFGLDMDSRITIVGPNGVGKSTLLHLITQEIEASMGEVILNRRLKIARYHQHFLDVLPMNLSPTEFLVKTYQAIHDKIDPDDGKKKKKGFYQEVRDRLGKFGLPGESHEIKMVNLSGGQKSRVVFASISFQMPHMIVLDEPTNNLDIESIDALSDAINEFEGGVILVSHDARLITTTDMVLWVCDKQTVEEIEGGFEAYREEILTDLQKRDEEERVRQEARSLVRAAQRQTRIDEIKKRAKAKAAAAV